MSSIQLKHKVTISLNELLNELDQLSTQEFEEFVKNILAARARRIAPTLPNEEAKLIQQINKGLAPKVQERFDKLNKKRRAETLTKKEHKELLKIINQIDNIELKRAEALGELSILRGVPMKKLVKQLGLKPHGNG